MWCTEKRSVSFFFLSAEKVSHILLTARTCLRHGSPSYCCVLVHRNPCCTGTHSRSAGAHYFSGSRQNVRGTSPGLAQVAQPCRQGRRQVATLSPRSRHSRHFGVTFWPGLRHENHWKSPKSPKMTKKAPFGSKVAKTAKTTKNDPPRLGPGKKSCPVI